ncbi:unnamed protein product [Schistosoma curassoni]|uniref:Uncharacterized protein n=1 Tax=Schistosoma curassoni TaxID=6186 RepID=A0A183KVF4_9TREM|nr:unnamed protein product [Schistosoma curassoni]
MGNAVAKQEECDADMKTNVSKQGDHSYNRRISETQNNCQSRLKSGLLTPMSELFYCTELKLGELPQPSKMYRCLQTAMYSIYSRRIDLESTLVICACGE